MTDPASRPAAVVFDLFGTLVFLDDSRVPRRTVAGRAVPMTIDGIDGLLGDLVPGVALEDFVAALAVASTGIAEEKRRLGIEVPTRVRFEKTLAALGAAAPVVEHGAREMARRHMETLAGVVTCPPSRRGLLASLAGRYRLALLSNFDHAPTARRVLAEGGLDHYLEVIVISEEVGLRKPGLAIFELAQRRLGVEAGACLFVGDHPHEDIEGASRAGMRPVWIRGTATGARPDAALGEVGDAGELEGWLSERWPAA